MIHHVSVEVAPPDAERMVEFWELLGFTRLGAPEEIAAYVTWLERDANQVHLIHSEAPTAPSLGHTAIVASAFAETVAALRAAGFEVNDAQELWGEPRAFATAPGGHLVELMRAPPAPSAS